MREEAVERPGRFSGFLGGVRLIFDACLFALVLLIIGFIVFANSVDREHSRAASGPPTASPCLPAAWPASMRR